MRSRSREGRLVAIAVGSLFDAANLRRGDGNRFASPRASPPMTIRRRESPPRRWKRKGGQRTACPPWWRLVRRRESPPRRWKQRSQHSAGSCPRTPFDAANLRRGDGNVEDVVLQSDFSREVFDAANLRRGDGNHLGGARPPVHRQRCCSTPRISPRRWKRSIRDDSAAVRRVYVRRRESPPR